GTSSLRRVAQLRFLRPDVVVVPLRGNVPTRVRKVETRDGLDAALLAIAGLERLGLGAKGSVIDPLDIMPAPGQGALGIEIRADDKATRKALQPLHDASSAVAITAERALLAALGGGCQAPVAAWVEMRDAGSGMRLYGRVTETDGAAELTASADRGGVRAAMERHHTLPPSVDLGRPRLRSVRRPGDRAAGHPRGEARGAGPARHRRCLPVRVHRSWALRRHAGRRCRQRRIRLPA